MQELEAAVALHYATLRPALAKGFAQFVFRHGAGATIPVIDNGRKVKHGGQTWQWLGREIYGQDFTDALKALIAERDKP